MREKGSVFMQSLMNATYSIDHFYSILMLWPTCNFFVNFYKLQENSTQIHGMGTILSAVREITLNKSHNFF